MQTVRRQLPARLLPYLVGVLIIAAAILLILLAGRHVREATRPLHGAAPPPGIDLAELSDIPGIAPPMDDAWAAGTADGPLLLVATCIDCAAGAVYGSALQRLPWDVLPAEASVHVISWQGDPDAWAATWELDGRVVTHAATRPAAVEVGRRLAVDPRYGHARIISADGRWVASYPSGSALPSEMAADLQRLA